MAIKVTEVCPRVFVASGDNVTAQQLGIAVRESKWAAGYGYAAKSVRLNLTRSANYSIAIYAVVPANTPNRPYSLQRAAHKVAGWI